MNIISKIRLSKTLFIEETGLIPKVLYLDETTFDEVIEYIKYYSGLSYNKSDNDFPEGNSLMGMKVVLVKGLDRYLNFGV